MRKDACLWIAFYFETEEVLTSAARVKAMRGALAHNHSWTELRQCKFEESRTVQVLLSSIWQDVDRRLSQLKDAQQMVVEDPEILRGTPVIRGTRIPVHDVASLVDAGTPIEEILEIFQGSRRPRSDWLRSTRRRTLEGAVPGVGPSQRSHSLRFQEATSWLLYRRLGVCEEH